MTSSPWLGCRFWLPARSFIDYHIIGSRIVWMEAVSWLLVPLEVLSPTVVNAPQPYADGHFPGGVRE